MTAAVIGLDLVTVFTVIIFIVAGPYIKKVTNNYFF
jgi:hypothetical protein